MPSSAPRPEGHEPGVLRHLAIIMDGNNRWARQRGLPGEDGHRAGEEAVHRVVRYCGKRGLEALTLFAFSSENWRRPPEEVEHLMSLFMRALGSRVAELDDNNVRLRFIGDREALSEPLQRGMAEAEQQTADNDGLTLVAAINYGGQWDIARAARTLAGEVEAGRLRAADIDADRLGQAISLADLPPPDLLVRTAGEQRISNFLLWQAAYSEFWFTPVLWPDFGERELDQALAEYAGRQRRFGARPEAAEGTKDA